jgi:hypothetical protein
LFMMFAPLEGWRHVKVTDRHAAIDYAHALKDLSDAHFPDAAKIVLVQDNLNTHKPASLYEAQRGRSGGCRRGQAAWPRQERRGDAGLGRRQAAARGENPAGKGQTGG